MNLKTVTKEEFEAKKALGKFFSKFTHFCTPSRKEFIFEDNSYGQIVMYSSLPKEMQFGQSEDEYKLEDL